MYARHATAESQWHLILQPTAAETRHRLKRMGYKPFPQTPLLLYTTATDSQKSTLFVALSQTLSTTELANTRCLMTRSPLNEPQILREFLYAQPLSKMSQALEYGWFFRFLIENQWVFHYQPIIDLATGEAIAHECLARAQKHKGELVYGEKLIDAAIATQTLSDFDEIAYISCLESISALPDISHSLFFVNISPNTLLRIPNFVAQNLERVKGLGLQPQQIMFELTELERLRQSQDIINSLVEMREQGFRIAIDDLFGCTLLDRYLLEFSPDAIKVDRRVIQGCSRHAMKRILLKSVLNSARELNCPVVAEGLETQEDIQLCRHYGVNFGQGFGLALPTEHLQPQPLSNWPAACSLGTSL
ncbi:MAG: EAL domain-containing protein [Jaaginema sp. PMC 1079.18]|nr:EAL domain-containing protein [Jaaginema sp. PMC 1080.18]MEC4853006.1 EAL domain-containing protein [Jaaginema sp. PMC 1079.18]MEC4868529.1 EAL domain-containing protein [Jaaginema sp. PMC 1078.18]